MAAAFAAAFPARAADTPGSARVDVPGFYPGSSATWARIMSASKPVAFQPDLGGLIVSHHMADQEYLAAIWHGVSLVRSVKLVVIFSPDHFTEKSTWASVPENVAYPTPFGTVEVAQDLCDALAARGLARISGSPFLLEHGIFAHTTFIARYFPGALILPILIGWDTERRVLDGLVSALEELSHGEVFFAASVDFSHYNPVEASEFHDLSSEKAVLTMDKERFYSIEIDSPPSLYVLASIMEDRGASRVERFLWTQLQKLYRYPIADNTSHLYFAYYPGNPMMVRAASIMIFPESPPGGEGALVPDALLDRWPPPRTDAGRSAVYPYLAELRGRENRFLKGSDLYLFDLSPGHVFSRVVSDMRVTVVTLAAGDGIQRSAARIARLARQCDALVVVDYDPSGPARAQWGEYAAAGARVIVGRGGGAPAAWRVEGGVLFIDGLGFWQKRGNSIVPSSMLGVHLDSAGCRVWEFPLSFTRGIPAYRDMPEAASYSVINRAPMARE